MVLKIKIAGELESAAVDEKVADVSLIKDSSQDNKSQYEINRDIHTAILEETNRAHIAEQECIDDIEALDSRIIIVEEAVGSGGSVEEKIANAIAPKANVVDVYTKTLVYNKTEINNMITTPNVKYITVLDYSSLPIEGDTDTIYRIASYDGSLSQVDVTKYSEYAWDGSLYVLLSVKTEISEVFDISKYNSDTTYADITDALGVGGVNIPEGLRKGGMSVKFIQNTSNKYVLYTLESTTFTLNPFKWVAVTETVNNVSEIVNENVISEDEKIQITNNNGTEIIHELTEHYANFTNLKSDNKTVLNTDDLEHITNDITDVKTNIIPAIKWLKLPIMLTSNNTYSTYDNPESIVIPCKGGDEYYIKGSGNNCIIAFIKTYPEIEEDADYATGSQRVLITGTNKVEGIVPDDAQYLYISYSVNNVTWFAEEVVINGYDYALGLFNTLKNNIDSVKASVSGIDEDMLLCKNATKYIECIEADNDVEFIELCNNAEKEITKIEGSRLIDVIDGLLFVEDEYDENNPDESKVVLDVTKERTKAKSFVAETFKTLDGVNIVKKNYFEQSKFIPDCTSPNVGGPLFYEGDTKANSNYIVNAVTYPNGEIIACRRGGSVVKIANDGTETEVLNIPNAGDWRGVFIDKDLNVYVSPHDSFGKSSTRLSITDRGLYRLGYGESEFIKVISLYNTESTITSETQSNDDTIWTMCQDNKGYLYAGVYAHTVRANPAIYRSTDGGETWTYMYNFITSGICPYGLHIHVIIYNEFDDKLYCIVGEVNEIYCSSDQGVTWKPLGVKLEDGKGSAMIAVKDGLIVGSDTAYSCLMSKVYTDLSHKTTGRMWANTVFAIRRSDLTGWLYAFTKIDSSVNVLNYMPPIGAIESDTILQNWKDGLIEGMSSVPRYLADWEKMYNNVKDYYPNDCIRPQHCAILCSKDDGETWQIVYKEERSSEAASGFPTTGYFRNGECLTGITDNSGQFNNPIIISEETHKYTSSGIDVQNEIFAKTLSNTVINN